MKPQQEVRYAFIGSGHFAACCLEILSDWRAPLWVATAPPRPAGRGLRLMETPVAGIAAVIDFVIISHEHKTRPKRLVSFQATA